MKTKWNWIWWGLALTLLIVLGLLSISTAWAMPDSQGKAAQAIEEPGPHACVPGPHSGTISTSQEWCLADSPHLLSGNVTVANGATLTIEPGVIVQGCDGCGILVEGDLVAVGTEAEPILFTSVADSGPGQWAGLRFDGYTNDADGHLAYVTVRYGGDANQGVYANISARNDPSHVTIEHSNIYSSTADSATDYGIRSDGAHLVISDTLIAGSQVGAYAAGGTLAIAGGSIAGNELDGLYVPLALASLTISGTRILNNGEDGIDYNGSAAVAMHYGQLYGNGGLGIRNRNASVCFDAAYNYWGDEAGPDDPDAADDGCMGPIANYSAGEGVSQDVYYYPWQNEQGSVVPLLTVYKSAEDLNGGSLATGDVIRYTIRVTNAYSITVTGATFTDVIPAHTTYVWDSDDPEADVETAELLAWQDLVLPTGTYSYTFEVTVDPDAVGHVITNTVWILEPFMPVTRTVPVEPPGGGLVQSMRLYLPLVVRH